MFEVIKVHKIKLKQKLLLANTIISPNLISHERKLVSLNPTPLSQLIAWFQNQIVELAKLSCDGCWMSEYADIHVDTGVLVLVRHGTEEE